MGRKQAEDKVVRFCNHFGMGHHKYGDVRYCIHCGKPLPKTERMPDYLVCWGFTYIEAKNDNGRGTWPWKEDIGPEGKRKNQRNWLLENGGWLFIELGDGPARPDQEKSGKSAYLIPFSAWVSLETYLEEKGVASIRKETIIYQKRERLGADVLLQHYRLDWISGKKGEEEGRWIPPAGHCWWAVMYEGLLSWMQFCESQL